MTPRSAKVRDQRAADVVRDVPGRDDRAALLRAEPVHHRLAAGRPAHALHPAVDGHDDDDRGERAVEGLVQAERRHQHAREQQPERQEVLRVAAVRDRAHQELREPVGDREPGQRRAELGLAVLRVLGEQVRDREREVVADQVVARVADEDAGEHAPAQALVLGIDAIEGQRREVRRRPKEADHFTGVGGGTAIPFDSSTDRRRSG